MSTRKIGYGRLKLMLGSICVLVIEKHQLAKQIEKSQLEINYPLSSNQ